MGRKKKKEITRLAPILAISVLGFGLVIFIWHPLGGRLFNLLLLINKINSDIRLS